MKIIVAKMIVDGEKYGYGIYMIGDACTGLAYNITYFLRSDYHIVTIPT